MRLVPLVAAALLATSLAATPPAAAAEGDVRIRTVAGTGPFAEGDAGEPVASYALQGPPLLAGRALHQYTAGDAGHLLRRVDLDLGTVDSLPVPPSTDLVPLDLRGGTLYVARHFQVLALDLQTFELRPVAGTGDPERGGGDGPALDARVTGVLDAVATADALHLIDGHGRYLRRVDLAAGRMETILDASTLGRTPYGIYALAVGGGKAYLAEADGVLEVDLATRATRRVTQVAMQPQGLAVEGGTLYVADGLDPQRGQLRAVDLATGQVRTLVAGDAPPPLPTEGRVPLAGTRAAVGAIRLDAGALLVRGGDGVLRYDLAAGTVEALTGPPSISTGGDGGAATAARLASPADTATDGTRLWIAESIDGRIREVDLATGAIRTLTTDVDRPTGLALDGGTLYVADAAGTAKAVDLATGRTTVVAPDAPDPDDDPHDVVVVGSELYVGGRTLRIVDLRTGAIRTEAATGVATTGRSSRAEVPGRFALAKADGAVFVADVYAGTVRRLDLATRRLTPVAAGFSEPTGLATDGRRLLVAERFAHRVRSVDLATGRVDAFAGDGRYGFDGELGDPATASLTYPSGVDLGADGRTWIADTLNGRIRVVEGHAAAVERLAGGTRYETAAAIARAAWPSGADTAFVVNGTSFADAVAAGPHAAALGSPVLLVERDRVPAATAAELERLRPRRTVVLGGTAAVADAVVAQLGAERVAGADAAATAAALSSRFAGTATVAHVVSRTSWPDAVTDGVLAAGDALLLTDASSVPAATEAALRGTTRAVVVGGAAAVGAPAVDRLRALVPAVDRIAGADRFATGVAVARALGATPSTVVVTTGRQPADALAGVPYAAGLDAPILLVERDGIPAATAAELRRIRPQRIVVLGGTGAVDEPTARRLAAYER